MLQFTRKEMTVAANEELEIKVAHGETKVERFLIEGRPYEMLSDHFGLSSVLNVKNPSILI